MHGTRGVIYLLVVPVLLCLATDEQCTGNVAHIADGSCDAENNNAECSYDGGDCCQCTCLDHLEHDCGYIGFDCRDPTSTDVFYDCQEYPAVSPTCSTSISHKLEVEDTASAAALARMVRCSSETFEVIWRGHVVVEEAIYISNGTIVNVTGSGSEAAIDGGGSTRLFTVVGATLHLSNMLIANGSAAAGGAIAASASSLHLDQTSFMSNSALADGGAIYAVAQSTVSSSGPTTFVGNVAGSRGGALYVGDNSNVSWLRDMRYTGTPSDWAGDYFDLYRGNGTYQGNGTVFSDNQALSGGAVFATGSSVVTWETEVIFFRNEANSSGGAMYISSGSSVSWFAYALFMGNVAGGDGGALYVNRGYVQTPSTSLLVNGSTKFFQNNCSGSGGALAVVTESTLTFETEDMLFEQNFAGDAGGAVFISGLATGPDFHGVSFMSNGADRGGAVSAVSSGTALRGDEHIPPETSFTSFDRCDFIDNVASSDGGAVYAWMGSCVISSTKFTGNVAVRGGAVYLASVTSVRNCDFSENTSGDGGGYAVYSTLGFEPEIFNSSFVSNFVNCDPGTYRVSISSKITDSSMDQYMSASETWIPWVPYYLRGVCEGCGDRCDNCSFVDEYSCVDQPQHTVQGRGGDLDITDIEIEPGYWRASFFTKDVRRCYTHEACRGGLTGAADYCKEGYKDECKSCLKERRGLWAQGIVSFSTGKGPQTVCSMSNTFVAL